MKKLILISCLCSAIVVWAGCTDFLGIKPNVNLTTPETYADLRAMLDEGSDVIEGYTGIIEMGIDDYYLTHNNWAKRRAFEQDVYLWKPEPFYEISNVGSLWSLPYRAVSKANIVLETLQRNKLEHTAIGKGLKGEALFIRSWHFIHLLLGYAPVYDPQTAATALGIPIRLSSSVEVLTTRASLLDSYMQVLNDLKEAAELLPDKTEYLTQATRLVALAALARVYLAMGDYELALHHADLVLAARPQLMDLNTLNLGILFPFPAKQNPEILYYASSAGASGVLLASRSNVDTLIFQSFEANDLRKQAFFTRRADGNHSFKGFYTGSERSYFAGLASNELYLIKAECLMRLDKLQEGMDVLNQLLHTRWKTGTYVPFQIADKVSTLKILYSERRKELMRRGVRWMDLKRLNREPDFAKTLVRKMLIDGKEEIFELPANDFRYVHLIPQDVIRITGIAQNPR